MGLEFRESANMLNAKNDRKVQAGMVFNVVVGEWPPKTEPVCAPWGLPGSGLKARQQKHYPCQAQHVCALWGLARHLSEG